jgi:hypothetical protein
VVVAPQQARATTIVVTIALVFATLADRRDFGADRLIDRRAMSRCRESRR